MAVVTVQQALKRVAENPVPDTDVVLDIKVHEQVCRALFEVANNPDACIRGSMRSATRAQRIILDRLVGTRRPGTLPSTAVQEALTFVDLTQELTG